jgi:photosystem II stability/assembly factor-like uncharacterized protein
MKTMKRLNLPIFFLLLAGLACGPLTWSNATAIPSNPPLAESTLPAATAEPTLESTTAENPTNPPPDTQPAPDTSPQPAAPAHHHPGDAIKLDEIHMFDAQDGWAVSEASVLVTADGAQTWREVTPPEGVPASSQAQAQGVFLDRLSAWVLFSVNDRVPPEAVVWHTTDSGLTWTASAPLDHQAYGDRVWAEFSALDAMHVWLMVRGVVAGAGIHYAAQFFRTTDGGLTWLPLVGDVGVDYTGLVFADPDHGWLTWQTTGAYAPSAPEYGVTSDGAVNWDSRELPPPPDAPDLFDTSPYCESLQPRALSVHSVRMLVGCFDEYAPPHVFSSYLYASEDGGATWTSVHLPAKVQASDDTLIFFDAQNALLLGRDIYRTADEGQTWSYVKSVNWDGQFSFVDAQTGWAVARVSGQIALVKTVNGGSTWSEIKPIVAP